MTSAADAVLAITRQLEADQPSVAARARAIRERLEGPLRVAIAGRVKAGKSTLLNALVGERLAPTDAGECTRIVTWYRKGASYGVVAKVRDGSDHPLAFTRGERSLDVQLGGLDENEVLWLDVAWPSSALDHVTLIDTPGLASINEENSRRTRDFLHTENDSDGSSEADAVIYLMRHLHASDVAFLDAFMDRSVAAASPVKAVAVLSRADEIGAGRLDAMESASRIAQRYQDDPHVRALCASVTPLAGLLAETGLTMREDEAATLRMLAATDPTVLERMLLSIEEFLDLGASDLTVELRHDLLDRLGMYGVRVALREVAAGHTTAAQLGPRLVELSGLNSLRRIIAEHFVPRARLLQARTAIQSLRELAGELLSTDAVAASKLDRDLEQLEASAVDFARLRAAHLVVSGEVRIDPAERNDLERLLLGTTSAAALGLGGGASPEEVRIAALASISRWRTRAGDPLATPALIEVCETAARSCEAYYSGVV